MKIEEWLSTKGKEACKEAQEWLSTFPKDATMNDAWKLCQNSEWMVWAAGRSPIGDERRIWRQIAFALARRTPASIDSTKTTWDVMLPEARKCLEVAEAYEAGTATAEERLSALNTLKTRSIEQFDTPISYFSSRTAVWCATEMNDRMSAHYVTRLATLAWADGIAAAPVVQANIIREFIPAPW